MIDGMGLNITCLDIMKCLLLVKYVTVVLSHFIFVFQVFKGRKNNPMFCVQKQ